MLEKADADHEISMFDIVSLYPYCNFTGLYYNSYVNLFHFRTIPTWASYYYKSRPNRS